MGMSARASRRLIRYGLLAALLLLGRSGLVIHDAEHWQPRLSGHVCALCLHHVGQNEIAAGSAAFVLEHVPLRRLACEHVHSVFITPHRRCPIRGPPSRFD